MPGLNPRRGASLAEMIVALTLTAIVSTAGVAALSSAERYITRSRAASEARRTLREAESVLATDLRATSPDSLRVRGDTAVDFLGLVGVSVLCASSGGVLVLPPEVSTGGHPLSSWRAAPEAGDLLALFDTADGGRWRLAVVDSASTRADGAGCTPSTGLISAADSVARRAVTRVVLRSTPGAAGVVGAPVRVMRAGRYALTRSGDGSWSLSYRRCAGASCGTAQPVVGPLAAPADSGIVFTGIEFESRIEVAVRTLPGSSRGACAKPESCGSRCGTVRPARPDRGRPGERSGFAFRSRSASFWWSRCSSPSCSKAPCRSSGSRGARSRALVRRPPPAPRSPISWLQAPTVPSSCFLAGPSRPAYRSSARRPRGSPFSPSVRKCSG